MGYTAEVPSPKTASDEKIERMAAEIEKLRGLLIRVVETWPARDWFAGDVENPELLAEVLEALK